MNLNGTKISELEIFRLVYNRSKVSRAELEKITESVSSSTLYRMLDQLVQKKYLFEESGASSSTGRPPKLYSINDKAAHAIGVFISWDCIGIGLSNIGSELYAKRFLYNLKSLTPREAIENVSREIRALISEYGESRSISGIGVSAFGPLIKDKGILNHGYHKLSPAWDYVPVKDLLERETNLPVVVDNLVNACLLNELGRRQELRQKKVVYILLDKGIGSAFFCPGGESSSKDTSSQIGHMTIDLHGMKCICGKYGCLETYASAESIVNMLLKVESRDLVDLSEDPYRILSSISERITDEPYRDVLDEIARALANGILNYCAITGPDIVLLGGRTVDALPLLIDRVESTIHEIKERSADHDTIQIEKTAVDYDALLRGSANIIYKFKYGLFT
jgi:predicted NBD/HSP70 family sugar kinase